MVKKNSNFLYFSSRLTSNSMSYDPNLSKYLMILGNEFQDGCDACGFPTRNCVTRGYKRLTPLHVMWSRIEAFSHLSDFGDVPAGCGNVYKSSHCSSQNWS